MYQNDTLGLAVPLRNLYIYLKFIIIIIVSI